MLEYAVGAATVAIAWSEYFNRVLEWFGMRIPYEWSHSPFEGSAGSTSGLFRYLTPTSPTVGANGGEKIVLG